MIKNQVDDPYPQRKVHHNQHYETSKKGIIAKSSAMNLFAEVIALVCQIFPASDSTILCSVSSAPQWGHGHSESTSPSESSLIGTNLLHHLHLAKVCTSGLHNSGSENDIRLTIFYLLITIHAFPNA